MSLNDLYDNLKDLQNELIDNVASSLSEEELDDVYLDFNDYDNRIGTIQDTLDIIEDLL